MATGDIVGRAREDGQFAVNADLDSGTCSKTSSPRSALIGRNHGCSKDIGVRDARRGETWRIVVEQDVLCSECSNVRGLGIKGTSATTDKNKLSREIRSIGRKRLASIGSVSAVLADGPEGKADVGHTDSSRKVAELTIG